MEAMDPAKGFIGKPTRQQIPQLCGRCHADAQFMKRYNPALRVDQVAEYATSVHGRRLRELSDPKVAVCVSCHPAHSIRPPSDPKSSVYPLHVAETCGRCHADAKYMAELQDPDGPAREVQDERSLEGDVGQGRPVRADLQRLPRQPRRLAARDRLGRQCLRAVPLRDGRPLQEERPRQGLRRDGLAGLRDLPREPRDPGRRATPCSASATRPSARPATRRTTRAGKSAVEMRALIDSLAVASSTRPTRSSQRPSTRAWR